MKCALCKTTMDRVELVRYTPNQNRPPYNPREVEVEWYTTLATAEVRHQSCHILDRVSAPRYRGM